MILQTIKALADPTRLRLMAILDKGEYTVQELTDILKMGQSRVSRHLKILRDVDVLEMRPQGTWNYYRHKMSNELFLRIWADIRNELYGLPGVEDDQCGSARIDELRRSRSRSFFDRVADDWDGMADRVLPTSDYHSRLLSRIDVVKTLVEIGIGNGELLAQLGVYCTTLIGIDQSPAMLQAAATRLKQQGLNDADLRLGEMSHLPLSDSLADQVVLNMVLHHASNPGAVLKELFRVLVPGGRILVADYSSHGHDWVRDELADQWLGFTSSDLEMMLVEAGFHQIEKEEFAAVEQGAGVLLFSAAKQITRTEKEE